jgi:pilus assembly protein CpaE
VLRALRGGAADYVDAAELDSELPPALERLQAEKAVPGSHGRVIGVLAPSGGSGSSTLAVNLATLFAKHHGGALLLDMKLETGDLATLLDLRPTHTLADLCLNVTRLDRAMFERSLTRHSSGVSLLAPPGNFADVAYVTPEAVRQTLMMARNLFSYVVVDLDHSFRGEQNMALKQADLILLVMRLDFTAVRHTMRTLDHLAHLGITSERVRLVVNRSGQPREVPAAKAEQTLGVRIFHHVPDEPKTVNRANNNGVPVVLESPSASVSKSLVKLAASLNGQQRELR